MDTEPIRVEYDIETRILGQRYLCIRKPDGPGYSTIPVAD